MHVILLPTVPHTGTHFMVEFFKTLPIVNHTVELVQLRKNEFMFAGNPQGFAGLLPHQTNLVYGHVYERELPTILALARWWRPVVPLRDPLASLITRQNRHPDQSHIHIVNAWIRMAEVIDELETYYLPLDLLKTDDQRSAALYGAVKHVNVGNTPCIKAISDWTTGWPSAKHNSRGDYELKQAYQNGDMERIEKDLNHEITLLRGARKLLQPFLEKQGYKDLLWWD